MYISYSFFLQFWHTAKRANKLEILDRLLKQSSAEKMFKSDGSMNLLVLLLRLQLRKRLLLVVYLQWQISGVRHLKLNLPFFLWSLFNFAFERSVRLVANGEPYVFVHKSLNIFVFLAMCRYISIYVHVCVCIYIYK